MKLWDNIKIRHYERCLKNDIDIYVKMNTYLFIMKDEEDSFYEEVKSCKDDLWLEILRYEKKLKELKEVNNEVTE